MKAKALAIVAALVLVVGTVVLVVVLTGNEGKDATAGEPATSEPDDPAADPTGDPKDPTPGVDPDDPAYAPAVSTPREDSLYPNVGDPSVDALHYHLDIAWDADSSTLTGATTLAFRATATAPEFQLDLGKPLEVARVTLDGKEVESQHNGKDLVVKAPVTKDKKYALVVEYAGTPEPAPAPTTRSDFSETGWTVTDDGEVWTMQEPYGAYTWYPVNDQPSDKAFYDFTITAPGDWVGVANGQLQSREEVDGNTVTEWSLDAPASSYLTTIAIGDLVMTKDQSDSGVPLTYWTPRGDEASLQAVRFTPEALKWNEKHLGKYPFESLGILVVDSESGMETQTMITLGDTEYTTSPEVLAHEITHQWYGDLVTPTDWKDVWMNEGMTMYLQGAFQADHYGQPMDSILDEWATYEKQYRAEGGPPGDYDPTTFGVGNIYYGPALMWDELRQKIGDKEFWAMVRKWPSVNAEGNATREEYLDWIEQETGEELTSFFDAWLLGKETPPRD